MNRLNIERGLRNLIAELDFELYKTLDENFEAVVERFIELTNGQE